MHAARMSWWKRTEERNRMEKKNPKLLSLINNYKSKWPESWLSVRLILRQKSTNVLSFELWSETFGCVSSGAQHEIGRFTIQKRNTKSFSVVWHYDFSLRRPACHSCWSYDALHDRSVACQASHRLHSTVWRARCVYLLLTNRKMFSKWSLLAARARCLLLCRAGLVRRGRHVRRCSADRLHWRPHQTAEISLENVQSVIYVARSGPRRRKSTRDGPRHANPSQSRRDGRAPARTRRHTVIKQHTYV